jgi:hypothetical protein
MRPVFAAPEFQMNEDPGVRKIEAEIKAAGVPESSITRLLRKEREYAKAYAAQLECDQEQTDSMAIPTPDTAVPSPPAKRRAKKKRAKTLARP